MPRSHNLHVFSDSPQHSVCLPHVHLGALPGTKQDKRLPRFALSHCHIYNHFKQQLFRIQNHWGFSQNSDNNIDLPLHYNQFELKEK